MQSKRSHGLRRRGSPLGSVLIALATALGACDGGSSSSTPPCESGTWDADSDRSTACVAWTSCPAGTYVASEGSPTSDRACTGCASGTFSTLDNAAACTPWTSCPAGTHVATAGSATSDRTCASCATGTYTSGPDQAICVPTGSCAPGTEQTAPATSTSAPTCRTCSAGEHCAGGSTPAVACGGTGSTATWDDDGDPSTACVARTTCVAGDYAASEGDATSDRTCASCAGGTFSASPNAPQCTAWTDCQAGEHVTFAGSATSDRTCAACADGTFSAGLNASQCTAWTDCQAGEYVVAAGSAAADRTCAACGSGTFGTGVNDAQCTAWRDCAAGSYVSTAGSPTNDRACMDCGSGTYTSGPNESACLPQGVCPAGTVQAAPGSSSSAPVCDDCVVGTYCAGDTAPAVACDTGGDGTWDHDADPATACVARSSCNAGSYVTSEGDATTNRTCAPCADGFFSTSPNAAACSAWSDCAAGTHVTNSPSGTQDRTCAPCADGSFSVGPNAASCTPWTDCAAGTFVSTAASASNDRACTGCTSGTFSTLDNAAACTAWSDCAAGTHVTNTPSDLLDRTCAACGAGTFTADPNLSACIAHGACAPGTEQTAAGTETSPAVCRTCVAGEYCAGGVAAALACGPSAWDHDADPSTACVARTDCAPGAFVTGDGSATSDRTCAPCAGGFFSTSSNAASCTAFTTCGVGYVESQAGTATTDRACAPAPWVRQFGSAGSDVARSVAVDASGNVLFAGHVQGALPGQTYLGSDDAVVRKYDVNGTELWTRQFGTAGYDFATSVAVDASGNVVVAGYTQSTLPGQTSVGSEDAFVRKYDANGTELWTRQFGSTNVDYVDSVAVDASGNVLVTGHTPGTLPGQATAGSHDVFVRKYDASGTELWTRQFGSANFDAPSSVAVDPSGNVVLAGYTGGALPGQVTAGGVDPFVRKYDASGTELWTSQFGSAGYEVAYSVAVGASGNVVVAGYTNDTLPGQTNLGVYDAFVRTYDPGGTELWTRQFGTAGYDGAYAVAVDANGNAVVAGYTDGALAGQTNAGDADVFLQKYDGSGAATSTQEFGTSSYDVPYSIAVSPTTNLVVAGHTGGTWPGQASAGGTDGFVTSRLP